MTTEDCRTYADAITKATAIQLKMHLHIFDLRTRSVVNDFVLLKEELFGSFKKVIRKSVLLWVHHKVSVMKGEPTDYNPRYFADFVFATESVAKELTQADQLTTHLEADVEVMRYLMAEVDALIDAELQPAGYKGNPQSANIEQYTQRLGLDIAAICKHINTTLIKMGYFQGFYDKEAQDQQPGTKYSNEIVRLFLDVIRLYKEITDCYYYKVTVVMDSPTTFLRKLALHKLYWLSLQRTTDKAYATFTALWTPSGLLRAEELVAAWRRWAQLMVRRFACGHANVLGPNWFSDPHVLELCQQLPAVAAAQPQKGAE